MTRDAVDADLHQYLSDLDAEDRATNLHNALVAELLDEQLSREDFWKKVGEEFAGGTDPEGDTLWSAIRLLLEHPAKNYMEAANKIAETLERSRTEVAEAMAAEIESKMHSR